VTMAIALRQFSALLLLAATMASGMSLAAGRNEVVEGNAHSSVRVVIYEDLQCADCARLRAMIDEKLIPQYGARVAFIHRDFPLGKHVWARQAAIAGRWVAEQDPEAGICFRREILAELNSITAQTLRPWLTEFAARYKLDQKGIVDALKDPRLATLVDQDLASGVARSVARVPTVFLGNQAFSETIIEDDLVRALNEALK
jgi:protein-disulfide isomerase